MYILCYLQDSKVYTKKFKAAHTRDRYIQEFSNNWSKWYTFRFPNMYGTEKVFP